jgi:hypothetical protein
VNAPVTVAAQSKAWNVFARLNTGIVGSNPARGMDVFCVYSVFVLSCVGSGLATVWSLVQGVLPIVYKCKITEPHKEEAKARYGLQRHIRRRYKWTRIHQEDYKCLNTREMRRSLFTVFRSPLYFWTRNFVCALLKPVNIPGKSVLNFLPIASCKFPVIKTRQ